MFADATRFGAVGARGYRKVAQIGVPECFPYCSHPPSEPSVALFRGIPGDRPVRNDILELRRHALTVAYVDPPIFRPPEFLRYIECYAHRLNFVQHAIESARLVVP
jgi:hypothetical protein